MCLADVSVLQYEHKGTVLRYESSYQLAWVLSMQAPPEDRYMIEK